MEKKVKTTHNPAVSVIIPVFNRRQSVQEAIESVFAQKFQDFELIVVDDGSDDGTGEALQKYGDRITYVYQENRGVSAARNRGIKMARGDFLAFLDSDDLWKRNKLAVQIEFLAAHPEARICYTNEIWLKGGKRINQKAIHRKYSGWIFDKVLPLCIISPSSVIIKKEVFDTVGLFDEDLPVCEDYDLWIRVARKYPIFFIDRNLIIKNGGRDDHLSKKYWGLDRFRVKALVKAIEDSPSAWEKELLRRQIFKKCTILSNGCIKRGREEEGQKYREIMKRYGWIPNGN